MEFQQLKHLLAVAKHGSLMKAAEASHISQSGLSRSIAGLEARVGVPLLVRKASGIEFTVYGESILQRATRILNEVARCRDEVRALESGSAGLIRLGITQNYALYLMPAMLAELRAERPGLVLDVVTGGFMDLVEMVVEGSVDMAFGLLGPIQPTDELVVERLREHHSRVISRSVHPLARAGSVSLDDLSAARWATLRSHGFQKNFADFFQTGGVKKPIQVLTTDSIELMRRFVLDSDVLTVLPADAVLADIDAGRLVILPCEVPGEITQLGLMFRAGSYVAPQVTLVADRIRAAVTGSARNAS